MDEDFDAIEDGDPSLDRRDDLAVIDALRACYLQLSAHPSEASERARYMARYAAYRLGVDLDKAA